jgi:hypothetical protein
MKKQDAISEAAAGKAEEIYERLRERAVTRMEEIWKRHPEYAEAVEGEILDRFCLNSELDAYRALFAKGAISDKIFNEMQERISERLRKKRAKRAPRGSGGN